MSNYTNQYFTTVAQESGDIKLSIPSYVTSSYLTYMAYSTDSGTTWNSTTIDSSNQSIVLSVSSGDSVMWKGEGTRLGWGDDKRIDRCTCFSGTTCLFYVEGNIMSLLFGDNFANQDTITGEQTFRFLFGKTKVTSLKNMVMPFTGATRFCLANFCESSTTLTEGPVLQVVDLNADYCYGHMFSGCTNLTGITCLATSVRAGSSSPPLANWVQGVSANGTFTKASGATFWSTGISGIPTNWTVEDYAPFPESASTFTYRGGTDSYELETEATWNASSDSLWISVSPSIGTGDSTLTITVGRNSGSADRTGTVTVTDSNDNTLLIWTVEQGYRATPIMNIIYNNSTW